MASEIGSEFHRVAPAEGQGLVLPRPGALVFSGRTAIETVLKEISEAKKALLPSYCCDSMIEPFRRAGIEVCFYPVNYENGLHIQLEGIEGADILVWCNYFGFRVTMPDLSEFIEDGGVIIEDITHSLFSEVPYNPQSHYLVASLRKWEPIHCGGYCASVNGTLHDEPIVAPPQEFIELKASAMDLKAEYLAGLDEEKKPVFLSMFGESNHWLAENYSGLAIDPWSKKYLAAMDMEGQKRARRKNAAALYGKLNEGLNEKFCFLFPEEDMDCPLFVPILLNNRDDARRHLTANKIYCPVHWPRPEGCESNLYDMELSLVCDWRYGEEDMERIVSVMQSLL